MIELRNFSIGYGRRELLADVNATFARGTLVALLGRNGAGKSTLLRAIAGLGPHRSGVVAMDGRDMADMDAAAVARTLAFVSTERVRVASLRCADIVAMGRAPYTNWIGTIGDADRAIVADALSAVGMGEFADRTMDTMSDGECQRIMIARALAQDTPVILLDEPTSFLDLPNRYELCLLLRRLARERNKCIVFSTHELDIALSLADAIALIESPHLHCLPVADMRASGLIERTFCNDDFGFDALTGQIITRR